MKAGTKLAHPSQCREVMSPVDLERYLTQGWCELKEPVSRNAQKFRRLRQRYKSEGLKRFAAYLPQAVFDELMAAKLPGETQADLIERLLHIADESPYGTHTK
jgi:hypothetical protein